MSDMLGISGNAIGAYQRALSTVSNNIANVNTEGYSRQDAVLKDSAPQKSASMFFGTGVELQTVKRQFDAFAVLFQQRMPDRFRQFFQLHRHARLRQMQFLRRARQ